MRWVGIVSGYACLGLSFLIVTEILGRKLFNVSIQGVDEIGGYVVAIVGTFGMALASAHRAHTRIDIVVSRLRPMAATTANLIAYLTLAIGASFMAYMAWTTLAESIEFKSVSSTPLQTPLWIPQLLWFAGLVVFSLTAIVMFCKGLIMITRQPEHARAYLAPTTLQDELKDVPE